jgi:hypothetical protein
MRLAFLVGIVLFLPWLIDFRGASVQSVQTVAAGNADQRDQRDTKSFGIDKRVPWTTSRVIGSPESPPPYRIRRTFEKLQVANPITIAHEPGTQNLLLIHQLWPWVGPGRILRLKDDGKGETTQTLLSLNRTMYGLAFHPHYRKNGYIYVGSNGPITGEDRDIPGKRFRPEAVKTTRISRFTVERQPPFACNPASEKVIIEWPSNGHNGGDLAFGRDGLLYISSGDGTADSDTDLAGQDLSRLTAKVLRIDVDHPDGDKAYSIPADNPFLKVKDARPETWAYGFRNPWRLHINRKNGDLWVGQNGQDLWEPIYLVERGANYGWSLFEGSHPFAPNRKQGPTPISKPIVEHHHSEARSLTGGLVYHGSKPSELQGAYLYGDWSTGMIWGLRHAKGKVTWHKLLADTTLQVVGFGTDSQGELLIVDYGGGLYRLEPAPKDIDTAKFPTKLSETGLFKSVKDHEPEAGLIPYSVNAPLWSDSADKERFIALPRDSRIDFTSERGWEFPEGAVLVKTFSFAKRRIETRLLTRQRGKWAGYSYVWNDEQTEATLVSATGMDRTFAIDDPKEATGKRTQVWHYPSRTECMVCHSRAANFVLGLNVLQMNKDHDYGGVIDNQLRTLDHLAIFRVNRIDTIHEWKRAGFDRILPIALDVIEEVFRQQPQYTDHLPNPPAHYPALVDPADARADKALRVRSYLHANCSQCHVRAGGGNSPIDLEFTTALDKMQIVGKRPQHQNFDLPEALLVSPGKPEQSILYHRVNVRGHGQMPPLATAIRDHAAVKLLRDWIAELK